MADDPLIDTQIGQVTIKSRLGAGAMGVVYRGWHGRLAREVAVKLLGDATKGNAKERFIREGQAAAKVSHEHVVQALEAGEHDGRAYLVMELVVGHSLGAILDQAAERKTFLAPEQVARIGVGMALGLAAIHAKGIVHRDIKPDNILINGADQKAKIADLGLAKQLDEPELQRLTGSGMVVGTPLYVSPEAIRDPAHIKPPADIYSLGATLYHALTNTPPFTGKTAYDVMRGHLEGKLVPLRDHNPAVPSGLAQLIERCLSKEAAKRPDAMELADLLGQGSQLRAKANLGLIVGLPLGALALAGAAFAGWQLLKPGPPPPPPTDAVVRIVADHPRLLVSVDGATPASVPAEGLRLTAGRHRIEASADQPGARLAWQGEVEAVAGRTVDARADLQPTALERELIRPVPGAGLLLRDGKVVGLDATLTIREAGSYSIARWTASAGAVPASFAAWSWTVDRGGAVIEAALGKPMAQPDGPAFWRTVDDNLAPVDPHHLVCWWFAEEARKLGNIPATPAWTRLRDRPEAPVRELSAPWVESLLLVAGPSSTLPDATVARTWQQRLGLPLWSRENGVLRVVGAPNAAQAGVVLVPR